MRGPMRKPMLSSFTDSGAVPETSRRALIPGREFFLICARPCFTMMRFSPRSGTMSATVAIARRSNCSRENAGISVEDPSFPEMASSAQPNFQATPAPASSLNADGHPGCLGLIISETSGRLAGTW